MIKNLKDYKDFRKVFRIFETEPFWEDWKENQIKEEFDEFQSEGDIFAKYDVNDIMGIVTLLYGARNYHPVIGAFEVPSKVIYISDLAVLHKYRGLGIGTELAKYAVEVGSLQGKESMYLRTNLEGSMSEHIFDRLGFEVMKDSNGKIITQAVQFPRCKENVPDTDIRKFMLKRLK